jgi:transcriptional regulator with XRE-family HTH domain
MSAQPYRVESWEVTAKQIRAARAYLSWTEAKLAQMSKLTIPSVRRIERDGGASARELSAVRGALEAAGIAFFEKGLSERGV